MSTYKCPKCGNNDNLHGHGSGTHVQWVCWACWYMWDETLEVVTYVKRLEETISILEIPNTIEIDSFYPRVI